MFVLDTNTLIYYFKGMGRVAERLLAHSPQGIGIPAVVVYELEVGIAKSTQPEKRQQQLAEMTAERPHPLRVAWENPVDIQIRLPQRDLFMLGAHIGKRIVHVGQQMAGDVGYFVGMVAARRPGRVIRHYPHAA